VSRSVGKLKDVMVVFLLCAPRLRREESEARFSFFLHSVFTHAQNEAC